jgi:hypothetical protein
LVDDVVDPRRRTGIAAVLELAAQDGRHLPELLGLAQLHAQGRGEGVLPGLTRHTGDERLLLCEQLLELRARLGLGLIVHALHDVEALELLGDARHGVGVHGVGQVHRDLDVAGRRLDDQADLTRDQKRQPEEQQRDEGRRDGAERDEAVATESAGHLFEQEIEPAGRHQL